MTDRTQTNEFREALQGTSELAQEIMLRLEARPDEEYMGLHREEIIVLCTGFLTLALLVGNGSKDDSPLH